MRGFFGSLLESARPTLGATSGRPKGFFLLLVVVGVVDGRDYPIGILRFTFGFLTGEYLYRNTMNSYPPKPPKEKPARLFNGLFGWWIPWVFRYYIVYTH